MKASPILVCNQRGSIVLPLIAILVAMVVLFNVFMSRTLLELNGNTQTRLTIDADNLKTTVQMAYSNKAFCLRHLAQFGSLIADLQNKSSVPNSSPHIDGTLTIDLGFAINKNNRLRVGDTFNQMKVLDIAFVGPVFVGQYNNGVPGYQTGKSYLANLQIRVTGGSSGDIAAATVPFYFVTDLADKLKGCFATSYPAGGATQLPGITVEDTICRNMILWWPDPPNPQWTHGFNNTAYYRPEANVCFIPYPPTPSQASPAVRGVLAI